MLSKGFRKYITPEQRRKFLQLFKQKFNNQEYLIFLKKFRGSMISKGRRSFSYKLFDKLRIYFKKVIRILNKKQKKNKKKIRIWYVFKSRYFKFNSCIRNI